MQIVEIKISELKNYEKNARIHPKKQIDLLAKNIERFGFTTPVLIDKNNQVIAGHGRLLALKQLNKTEVPCVLMDNLTDEEVKALRLADNQLASMGEYDMSLAIEELKGLSPEMFDLTGFDADILNGKEWKDLEKTSLAESFIIPPFSVWDTRQQYWQERKKRWQRFFGDSTLGRDDDLIGGWKQLSASVGNKHNGTSEFDPVISDICYRWFNIDNGKILDPFAGGTVRGVVAGVLKMPYYGIDLSIKQIEENRKKTKELDLYDVNYFNDNSENIDNIVKEEFDLLFTCPPYYDLEEYNDGEGDLSMADTYEKFLLSYESILKKSINKLKNNRFAIIIVGEIRDKEGVYRGFVKDTISIMEKLGMKFYNDIILVNSFATAGLRARKQFENNRKVVKTHQNILAFYKGDINKIKKSLEHLPKIERHHENIIVFYKGDIEEIRNNYKFINTELIME